jgi:hypothetical protein
MKMTGRCESAGSALICLQVHVRRDVGEQLDRAVAVGCDKDGKIGVLERVR